MSYIIDELNLNEMMIAHHKKIKLSKYLANKYKAKRFCIPVSYTLSKNRLFVQSFINKQINSQLPNADKPILRRQGRANDKA